MEAWKGGSPQKQNKNKKYLNYTFLDIFTLNAYKN